MKNLIIILLLFPLFTTAQVIVTCPHWRKCFPLVSNKLQVFSTCDIN